ncbi:MAG: hypothetical protein WCC12_11550 [Anaerolineales bacterium]
MHNKLVRNSLILLIVLLFVVSTKGKLVNALLAIWVGAWVMSKSFNPMFGPHQGFENLTVNEFIPEPRSRIIDLFFGSTRKQGFFVLLWWFSGISTAFLIYQLLKVLLISS